MSEEEKQAINYLKEFRDNVYAGVGTGSVMAKNIDMIFVIIDKQQKEIERLKQIEDWKNFKVYKNVEDYEIHDKYGKNNLLTKCIHKDEIRHIRDKAECMDYYSLNDVIDDLSKLLGDENNE